MGQIVHVVLQKPGEGVKDDFFEAWATKGEAMLGKIPGLVTIKCGPVLESSKHKALGYTTMLYSVFEDEDSLRAYQTHPVHVELVEFGKGKIAGTFEWRESGVKVESKD